MLEIARILKPQGIKGEVKAELLTDVVSIFDVLTECLVGNKTMHIQHVSLRQGFLYIKFDEIKTRNDAELYRNQLLKVEKSLLEELKDEDALLVDDLIGAILYDDQGNMVGQIMEILNYGASDIFVVEKEGRTYDIPYVEDIFSLKDGQLIVDSKRLEEVMV
ncbi:MAG: 16S rRNA processing protein RimM [Clostridia bacterium]|nr:16S rRNA processing protein RimM [Clostridia bacterium]MBQ8792058.1 16S rRNA processing protein RimM [Clostridia bacterium]